MGRVSFTYNKDLAADLNPLVQGGDLLAAGPGEIDALVDLTLRHDNWRVALIVGGKPGIGLPKVTAEQLARINVISLPLESQGGAYTADDLTPRVHEIAAWAVQERKRLYLWPQFKFANTHTAQWAQVPGVVGFGFQLMRFQQDPGRYASEFARLANAALAQNGSLRFESEVSLVQNEAKRETPEQLADALEAAAATGLLYRANLFYGHRDPEKQDVEGLAKLVGYVRDIPMAHSHSEPGPALTE